MWKMVCGGLVRSCWRGYYHPNCSLSMTHVRYGVWCKCEYIFCYLPNKTTFDFMWPSYMYIAFALLYIFYKVDKRINLQLFCCFCREETKNRINCEIWASSKSFLLHPQQHAFGISSLIFLSKVILYLLFYFTIV